jgi:hypothetical protein
MSSTTNPKRRLRPHARSFLDSVREFLTPSIWRQAEQARRRSRSAPRWKTQPLVLTLLVMTWCCGDSQAERFETARGFTTVCLAKRLNRERSHLQALLPTLPPAALIVADAGYNGYALAQAIVAAGAAFLIRMSSKDRLYTELPPKTAQMRKFANDEV